MATEILFCETNVDGTIGGSYYSLLYLIKGLDRSRYHATALFYRDHGLIPAFHHAGADTVIWPWQQPSTLGAALPSVVGWLKPPAAAVRKGINFLRGCAVGTVRRASFLRARNIKIVHLNNSITRNHEWMAAAILTRTCCISHERGINETYSATSKYLGSRLGAVICISHAVEQNMRKRGASFSNLVTIPNGLDPDVVQPEAKPEVQRARYGISATASVVVMVGNIKPWKGQETLIHAVYRARRQNPDIHCVLVGDVSPADRSYAESLRALVSTLRLDDCVTFAGYQRNVADFLAMSDVVVHASILPEPFGRVVLEAMACRRPVIGARAGAIPELISDETGITFPPGDCARLADAISDVLRDRERARRLGQRGYDRLVNEFHISRNVDLTQQLYARLLGGNDATYQRT